MAKNTRYYRFMSHKEFVAYLCDETLENHKVFSEANTASFGFCFMACDSRAEAEDNYDFLSGIVSKDVLVEFEVEDPSVLTESWGIYADPCGGWFDTVRKTEWCTESYSRKTFRLKGFTHFDYGQCEWTDI